MSKKPSGFIKVEAVETGGDLANPAVTIEEEDLVTDNSQLEVEENEDQTDPSGESPHSGQFGNLTIESHDFSARGALVNFRTADPEQLIDVRVTTAGGQTLTCERVRAKTSLGSLVSEKGQTNTWQLMSRAWVPGVIDFDA